MSRKSIPKPVRTQVWNKHIGEENGIGKCDVCATEIKVSNFDCGHIIASADGGEDIINNLVPICRLCNLSMSTDNLNDFKQRYFSDKSYVDIYVKNFVIKTDELVKVSRYMGYREYEYPSFLSLDEIYNDYKKWIYYNHTKYYEEVGMNRWLVLKYPDKSELTELLSKQYGDQIQNPMNDSISGFINIKFK
jgi:hypothetical protein